MARMIPNSVSPDTPSQAEFDLFRDLDAALDDEFVVFHSMPWLASDQRGFQEGECDFLVLHPLSFVASGRRSLNPVTAVCGVLEMSLVCCVS